MWCAFVRLLDRPGESRGRGRLPDVARVDDMVALRILRSSFALKS